MGKRVWFPVVSGPFGAVRGGVRVVVAVAVVFAFGGGGQAVSAGSAQSLA